MKDAGITNPQNVTLIDDSERNIKVAEEQGYNTVQVDGKVNGKMNEQYHKQLTERLKPLPATEIIPEKALEEGPALNADVNVQPAPKQEPTSQVPDKELSSNPPPIQEVKQQPQPIQEPNTASTDVPEQSKNEEIAAGGKPELVSNASVMEKFRKQQAEKKQKLSETQTDTKDSTIPDISSPSTATLPSQATEEVNTGLNTEGVTHRPFSTQANEGPTNISTEPTIPTENITPKEDAVDTQVPTPTPPPTTEVVAPQIEPKPTEVSNPLENKELDQPPKEKSQVPDTAANKSNTISKPKAAKRKVEMVQDKSDPKNYKSDDQRISMTKGKDGWEFNVKPSQNGEITKIKIQRLGEDNKPLKPPVFDKLTFDKDGKLLNTKFAPDGPGKPGFSQEWLNKVEKSEAFEDKTKKQEIPIMPIIETKEPSIAKPIDPAAKPIEPAVEPTSPTKTAPITKPIEPSAKPIEPAVEPTSPTKTAPITKPIEPAAKPIETVAKPLDSVTKTTAPVAKPVEERKRVFVEQRITDHGGGNDINDQNKSAFGGFVGAQKVTVNAINTIAGEEKKVNGEIIDNTKNNYHEASIAKDAGLRALNLSEQGDDAHFTAVNRDEKEQKL